MAIKYSALCCYFGKWPSNFKYWLNSCKYNTDIDFIFVTDISMEGYDVPENVKILNLSFKDVQEKVKSEFPEINVSLDRPYKLCDFKVAYGYIFNDFINEYDYWGFFDIDTIWGDVIKFIPKNEDKHLTKIFPCGHLCFIKNNAQFRECFKKVNKIEGLAPWEIVFSTPQNYFYDEEGGLEPLFVATEGNTYYGGVDFDNVLPPWKYGHFTAINTPQKSHFLIYEYKNGRIYRWYLKGLSMKKEELSYLHISRRYLIPSAPSVDEFVIYPDVIAPYFNVTFWKLLYFGRPRYLKSILNRGIQKLKSIMK